MGTTTVRWITGEMFAATDSNNHSVVLSTTKANVGMKPSELLVVALCSCTSVDIVNILEKKRKPLESLEVQAVSQQDPEPPWTFRKIHLKFILKGKDLTPKDVAQAIELSEEKYCSVSATLRPTVEITWEYEIL
ncbi:MAG: OsmC family protein [Chloroflexi bacterium]|nr:OsmC family protein [Chloroflexota bacterium]